MQAVTRDTLIARAAALLADGTVERVYGWKQGEFSYDVTPALFADAGALSRDFVYGDFCGANLSKYLVAETRKGEGRVLVFLKPCDTYSFNQLLTEHRFDREKVYVIGVPCDGMADIHRVRALVGDGVTAVDRDGDDLIVHTLFDGDKTLSRADCLAERCQHCKSRRHVAFDEVIGEEGAVCDSGRFDEVEALERLTPEARFAFWQSQLSRCIRCNACRDICPACTCETCVFDNPESGVQNKAAADPFEEKLFHLIRAYHVAGRCTDCGECARVCPQRIPLHLLNRKFIRDIDRFYGAYQAGETVGSRAPLVDFCTDDIEPDAAVKGGGGHA